MTPPAPVRVAADRAECRLSNVALGRARCELGFGGQTVALQGRAAFELAFALQAAGVQGEGAAGSQVWAASRLACTLEPRLLAERAGGGARCNWAD